MFSIPNLTLTLAQLPDDTLVVIGRFVETDLAHCAPEFAAWLHPCLVAESERRKHAPDAPAAELELPDWGPNGLADALVGATALSYLGNVDAATSAFLDTLIVHVTGAAGRKLRELDGLAMAAANN